MVSSLYREVYLAVNQGPDKALGWATGEHGSWQIHTGKTNTTYLTPFPPLLKLA